MLDNIKTEQLVYLKEFDSFGIEDTAVNDIIHNNKTPVLSLPENAYQQLDIPAPTQKAPLIGVLLGRDENAYTIGSDYIKSLAKSNVRIRFLTYDATLEQQMQDIDGLLLPGGVFTSPNEFYSDNQPQNTVPSLRSNAYMTAIAYAQKKQMPMLGICAGAQMIGGTYGLKMLRSIDGHKSKELHAHKVHINKDSFLYSLFQQETLMVNSRHSEAMDSSIKNPNLQIYATSEDGIPEAWGNKEKGILCLQWHPENFAAQDDISALKIFNWFAQQASFFQNKKYLFNKQEKSL